MEPFTSNPALVVILGPTAAGKTSLAIKLARQFNGEIVAADSRTIYKGMDIGTAKPSKEEQGLIRHHLLDVVFPGDRFTVADFQRMANSAIAAIATRGKLPILVGGSGLYIDAVIYSFSFRGASNPQRRKLLESLSVEALQLSLRKQKIALPKNERNPRQLIRALESEGALPHREPLRQHTIVIGLDSELEVLQEKITKRVDSMVDLGFVEEVRGLGETYGWDIPALQAPGYRAFRSYLLKEVSLVEAKKLFVQRDLQYAKRQKTWFKRNSDIHWISKPDEAVDLVTTFLNK